MKAVQNISPKVFPLLATVCRNNLLGKETLVSEIRILKSVAAVYGIEVTELMQRTDRKYSIVQARQMVMLFARQYTKLGLKDIGKIFEKRYDHSSVSHSIQTIQNDMRVDDEIKERYARVEQLLFDETTIGKHNETGSNKDLGGPAAEAVR